LGARLFWRARICVTYKAEVFNLGVDGQIYMGATAATAVALHFKTDDSFWGLLVVFMAAMLAGAIWAMIPALLKIIWRTDEVVATLLFNFIATLFVEFMVTGPLRAAGETTKLNASDIFRRTSAPRLSFSSPPARISGFGLPSRCRF
jgi:simple sugar transport system permease protein